MKRIVFASFLLLFAMAALAASPPGTMQPTQRAITKFAPLNFREAADREKQNPPQNRGEIEEIDAPQLPPPMSKGVPIQGAAQLPTTPWSTPSFGTGISPPPAKTFKAEFLSSTSIPPDTMGAVGSTHVITVTNDRMRILTRDGIEVSRLTLTSFWTGVTIKGAAISAFDPKVLFDRFNNRFILISSGNAQNVNSGAMFAVSATADPTGTWFRWSVATDPASTAAGGHWIDYPTAGHNKNWIVIDENVFNFGTAGTGYFGQQIYVLDKQAAYANTLGTINLFTGDFTNTCLPSANQATELACGFTMAPAITEDNTTDTEYMVEDWDSAAGQLRLSKFTGTPSAPVLTVGTQFPQSSEAWRFDAPRIDNSTTATVSGTITSSGGYMPQRQQSANLASGTRVMANDSRVQNAVLRAGTLWCTHTVMLASASQPAGTTIGGAGNPVDQHSGIQWWAINPTLETGASTAPIQRGRIHDPTADNCHNGLSGQNIIAGRCTSTATQTGEFFAFPNISVNQNNDVFIGFTRFSPLTYPNSGYVMRAASDPPNTTRDPVVFRPGQANYNIGSGTSTATFPTRPTRQNRWGDYSAAQTDPLNDTDFWTVQEYSGTVRDFGIGLAGNWETWWSMIRPGAAQPVAGNLIISEFRLRGPQGVRDEFIELYNPGTSPVIVQTTDGSDGWALANSNNGTTVASVFAVIPNGTVIPAHGHFLVADNPDAANGPTLVYSLNGAPSIQARGADSDTGWSLDLADNGGIALFKTATTANFSAATRLDSVGFASIATGLFKEGNGIAPITATTPTGQMTFYRDLSSGTPKDTDVNESDFIFANSVAGETLGGTPRLGAAGPENLDSPTSGTGTTTLPVSLVDTGLSAANAPNRVRDNTVVANGALGTLTIRRTFTNSTGTDLTRLRFRISDMTTNPPGGGNADLRALTSGNTIVSLSGGGSVNVSGTTLETPPAQAAGGGLNATFSPPGVTLATPLATGAPLSVQFTLGVQTAGTFEFCIFAETVGVSSAPVSCFTGNTENQPPLITPSAPLARTQAAAASNATIATVSDSQDGAGSLVVVATSVPSGISVTSVTNTGGTVTADVAADCSATAGANNVTLLVTDSEGATATATLVVNVTAVPVPLPPTIAGTTNGTGTQDQACVEQPLTLTATTTGATSYQWYQDNNTLNGETNSTTLVTGVGTYYVTATNVCGTSAQSAGYAVQNPTPHAAFITPGGPTTFCSGGSVTLSSNSATGIQWYLNSNPIGGANSQTYIATATGSYNAQLNALGCHSQFGNATAVTVNPNPATPTITPGGPTTFFFGGSVTLTSSSASGNQWYLNGNPIGGATSQSYVATAGGNYTVVVTGGGCSSAQSSATTVTVNPPQADLALTITDHRNTVMIGNSVNYIIEVTNSAGPSPATANVTDALPAGLINGSWACVPFGGATCANGVGNTLNDAATLPVGSKVAYVYSATVMGGDASDHIVNTASVAIGSGSDPVSGNNSASDTDSVEIFVDGFEGTPLMTPNGVGNGAGYVSATLRVNADLLSTLSFVPTTVAAGRGADGKTLFTLEMARFAGDVSLRVVTLDARGMSQRSSWQVVDLHQSLLTFDWQSASGASTADGYIRVGSAAAPLLLGARDDQGRLTQLWVTTQNSVPWLVLVTH